MYKSEHFEGGNLDGFTFNLRIIKLVLMPKKQMQLKRCRMILRSGCMRGFCNNKTHTTNTALRVMDSRKESSPTARSMQQKSRFEAEHFTISCWLVGLNLMCQHSFKNNRLLLCKYKSRVFTDMICKNNC